jgi:hypothetical protein
MQKVRDDVKLQETTGRDAYGNLHVEFDEADDFIDSDQDIAAIEGESPRRVPGAPSKRRGAALARDTEKVISRAAFIRATLPTEEEMEQKIAHDRHLRALRELAYSAAERRKAMGQPSLLAGRGWVCPICDDEFAGDVCGQCGYVL